MIWLVRTLILLLPNPWFSSTKWWFRSYNHCWIRISLGGLSWTSHFQGGCDVHNWNWVRLECWTLNSEKLSTWGCWWLVQLVKATPSHGWVRGSCALYEDQRENGTWMHPSPRSIFAVRYLRLKISLLLILFYFIFDFPSPEKRVKKLLGKGGAMGSWGSFVGTATWRRCKEFKFNRNGNGHGHGPQESGSCWVDFVKKWRKAMGQPDWAIAELEMTLIKHMKCKGGWGPSQPASQPAN